MISLLNHCLGEKMKDEIQQINKEVNMNVKTNAEMTE